MKRRGYEAGRTRSRKFTLADFQNFDLILAMDLDNLAELKRVCPVEQSRKLSLFLDGITLDDESGMVEAPNPSHGNLAGFEAVLDLCEAGAKTNTNSASISGWDIMAYLFVCRWQACV